MVKYSEFVRMQEARGLKRKSVTLTPKHSDIVTLADVAVDTEGVPITIKAPAGQEISIKGTEQIDVTTESAHFIYFKLADSTGEIADESPVDMRIVKTSLDRIQGPAGPYAMFNQLTAKDIFRPVEGIYLKSLDKLEVVVTPKTHGIEKDYINLAIQCDLWT